MKIDIIIAYIRRYEFGPKEISYRPLRAFI